MNQNWHSTLIRHLLLLVTACLLIGLVSGYYGWSLAAGVTLYLGWTLKQLLRLHDWLRNHQPDEAPLMAMACGAKCSTAFITCNGATSGYAGACKL